MQSNSPISENHYIRVLYSFGNRMGYHSVGTRALYQIESIVEQGCQMTICSASYDKIPKGIQRKESSLDVFGHRIPFRLIGRERARRIHDQLTARLLNKLKDKIDIVHCWPGSALKTLQTARKLGIRSFLERSNSHTKYAYDITKKEHAKLGIELPEWYSHTPNKKHLEREEQEYEMADKIAVPSKFVARTFLERGFDNDKLASIQFGYSPMLCFTTEKQSDRGSRPFTVLYAGQGEPRKGLHYALQAWVESGLNKKGKFIICGDLDLFPSYRRHLDKWLSDKSVDTMGFVKDITDVMRSSDVLVLPSLEEGSAKVTYEARACGCVLAVSDCSGAHCQNMYDSLIHKGGDVAELKEHLLTLALDKALFDNLKRNSLAGLDKLTWSHAGKVLVREYRNILS